MANQYWLYLTVIFLHTCLKNISSQQLVSFCPKVFNYEPRNDKTETDRWYGNVVLNTDQELNGVWLRIILDKPSIQLGNWFGEVSTTDNKEYLVANRNYKLKPNQPYTVRFYIKYNPNESPPILSSFRLNARTQCPEGGVTTPAPITFGQLLTSSELGTSTPVSRPFIQTTQSQPSPSFVRPDPVRAPSEEDYFFPGDFNYNIRPDARPDLETEAACGTVVMHPKPLITYGQATEVGEFPWHAALYHSRGIALTYICGASLVSKYHLVTVAHCVTQRKKNQPVNPESLIVYLGKYYLNKWADSKVQDSQVDKILVHGEYNPQTYTNDIAIIKLKTPAEITNYVRPVCLWDSDAELKHIVNKSGTVVGWGFDERGIVTEKLTKAAMQVVSQETCIFSFPEFFSRFASSKTFCAGFKNGTSVCNGDSGGGMVFPLSDPNSKNPIWHLRGLVSISVALQNQLKCDSSHYVVFTDAAQYTKWIRSSLV